MSVSLLPAKKDGKEGKEIEKDSNPATPKTKEKKDKKAKGKTGKTSFENLTQLQPHFQGTQQSSCIYFGDLAVGEECVRSFQIKNTETVPVRFQWDETGLVTFSPSVGHLPPGSSKSIQVGH